MHFSYLKCLAKTRAVSPRPLTRKALVRSQASPFDICGGQGGTGRDFFPSTSGFPYQYHCISSSATRCPYQKGKRAKPGKLARKNFSSGYQGAFDIKVLSLFSYFKVLAMAQPNFRRPLTADARVRIHAIPCEICDGENVTGTGFCATTSVVPCLRHFTNALCSSSSARCCYQKNKRAKPEKSTPIVFRL